jgi:hypothetical protein
VELDTPGGVADSEGLEADAVPREGNAAGREVEGVAVPLERLETLGRCGEEGIAGGLGGQLDFVPADLLLHRRPHMRPRGLRDQLAAEADAEERQLCGQEPLDQVVLRAKPGMLVYLIDVHAAPEHEDGVEGLRRLGRGAANEVPFDQLAGTLPDSVRERPRGGVILVDQ